MTEPLDTLHARLHAALREPPALLRELARLPGCWLAGGWLRDACWGHPSPDIDLAVEGPLEPVLSELERLTGRQFFKLNARFESYGLEADGWQLDVVPLHSAGIAADVARRDYTINALLFPLARLEASASTSAGESAGWVACDPRSWGDLAARRLRMTSAASLADDLLRVLRGYRLAAQWRLDVEPETRGAWSRLAQHVKDPAAERVHEELLKLFGAPCAAQLRMMAEDGALWELFPPLKATQGCDQLGYHHLDVWEHTLLALDKLEEIRQATPPGLAEHAAALAEAWEARIGRQAGAGALTRLALLLHDVAKPPTREVRPDGRASFHGHQDVGAALMQPIFEALKFSKDETDFLTLLIRQHMRLGYYSEPQRLSPKLAYRFIRQLGAATPLMVLHTLADCAATGGQLAEGSWERHTAAAQAVLSHFYAQDTVAKPPLLLDGEAIMRLTGLPPGRRIGELKEALLEATAAGDVSGRAAAERFVLAAANRLPTLGQFGD